MWNANIIPFFTVCYVYLEYRFLVESTKIQYASFPYKTTISEANVKTNRMVSTKWTYREEWSFASNFFIFLKILFQFKNHLKRVDVLTSQMSISLLFISVWALFEGPFSLWVSLREHEEFFVLFYFKKK